MSGKILIVDDSVTLRETLRITLEGAGYTVDMGVNGVDGLEIFSKNKNYDLIISDVNMPEMNGIDFLMNLRKINKDIPFLVLTTETEKDKIEAAKKYKATGWIVKPFGQEDLLQVVNKVIK